MDSRDVRKELRFYHRLVFAAALILAIPSAARALPSTNQAPPMGWEPWNFSHCGTMYRGNAAYYQKLADFFVSSGLRDLGYRYLTITCHDHTRDQNGQIQPNPANFPHGFKVVTDYFHARGLKARFYTDAGKWKCAGDLVFDGPGSFGHYEDDAKQWKRFGFDGVKIDWCGGYLQHLDIESQYKQFASAIQKVLPDFSIEICTWGEGSPWKWGRNAGTFWRTGDDIDQGHDTHTSTIGGDWSWLLRNIDANRHASTEFVGPGKGWNYPDMLEVGVPGGLNEVEERTQFSMWAVMAAPLILGNDVFNMPDYAKEIIMNKEVIAVDQDPLGMQGDVVKESDAADGGTLQVWSKELKDGSKAVALLNRGAFANQMTVSWSDLGFSGKCDVRDLWQHADKGNFATQYSVEVPSHGTILLKVSPLHSD